MHWFYVDISYFLGWKRTSSFNVEGKQAKLFSSPCVSWPYIHVTICYATLRFEKWTTDYANSLKKNSSLQKKRRTKRKIQTAKCLHVTGNLRAVKAPLRIPLKNPSRSKWNTKRRPGVEMFTPHQGVNADFERINCVAPQNGRKLLQTFYKSSFMNGKKLE